MRIEIFACSGGMAAGFRAAGIEFDMVVDYDADACASYEANMGLRPMRMDARDLLRMIKLGWRPAEPVDLLVADPPCTPRSRAGKRLGNADERDMIDETCELIELLRPRAYLIGNVPGLEDSTQWPDIQRALDPLRRCGYCVRDFATLDAADFGVPQHRVRPFWFGHLAGPCVRWPTPTHASPEIARHPRLDGVVLRPWVTCRVALAGLTDEERGRPVRLRRRAQNSAQHGSVLDRPARVVGTSNLSDGNVLLPERGPGASGDFIVSLHDSRGGPSTNDAPAKAITTNTHGVGSVLVNDPRHPPSREDEPALTIPAKQYSTGGNVLMRERTGVGGGGTGLMASELDKPAKAVTATSLGDGRVLVLDDKHPPSELDEPARALLASDGGGAKGNVLVTRERHDIKGPDEPARVITTKQDDGRVLEWPWEEPATTVTAAKRIPPPGEDATLSQPDAVVLSELAGALLQGFPRTWQFIGATKRSRWSMLGQAMPPALAEVVARAIAEQERAAQAPLPTLLPRHVDRVDEPAAVQVSLLQVGE